MPPSKRAVAVWDGLNERQREYMRVIYEHDQAAEKLWKGAWGRGETPPPASEWRWLEYGNVGGLAQLGKLQSALQRRGVRDPGAGSTLEALQGRGLIETREKPALLGGYRLEVKLTTLGRAACRAGGLDPDRALAPRRGLLSEALWAMLVDVHAAGPEGLRVKWANGPWERLLGRAPDPFVAETPADGGEFGPWLLRLTDAGRAHYAANWRGYARLYPGVNAPDPDGALVWPVEIDRELRRLREAPWPATALLKETRAELARLDEQPGGQMVEVPADRGGLARIAARRNKAAAAYGVAVAQAADRYRAVLEEQAAELVELRWQGIARYAAAATAVVNAAVAGTSLTAALEEDPGPVVWPWAPDVPVTGLPEVDESLTRAHPMAKPKQPSRKRRPARACGGEDGASVEEDKGTRLLRYAMELEGLVAGGKLVRLMMRDRSR
ncbi:hypothetical protein [Nonomuraea sp. NPDC023979]|uniref:hypothetical protein n=1 Tax=Nonomuraea sp. NPDC023979 TaxID=3154796 RepID=UPI0033DE2C69